jgi:hypothetical protein
VGELLGRLGVNRGLGADRRCCVRHFDREITAGRHRANPATSDHRIAPRTVLPWRNSRPRAGVQDRRPFLEPPAHLTAGPRAAEGVSARARGRGDGGEGSNRDKERAEYRRRSRSSPTHRGSAAGHKKAFGDSAGGPGGLGVTTSYRTRARNRARLRGSRLTYQRHDLAALRRNPGDGRCLSCARRDLVALASTKEGPPMTSEPMPMPVAAAGTVSP